MNTQPIESGFAQMGARFKVREIPSVWRRNRVSWFDPREQLPRSGGETVYVCRQRPNGLTEKEYRALLQESSEAAPWG